MALVPDSVEALRLLPTSIDVSFVINSTIADKLLHFVDLVPFKSAFDITVGELGDLYIYRLEDTTGHSQSNVRILTDAQRRFLSGLGPALTTVRGKELYMLLRADWVAWNKFTYVGHKNDASRLAEVMGAQLLEWMNTLILPMLDHINRQRIQPLLPPRVQIDLEAVSRAMWVLEGFKPEVRQGTAFNLTGIGLITCEHVLTDDTVAFQPHNPSRRIPARVLRRHKVIDLAVVDIGELTSTGLLRGSSDDIQLFTQLLVAGFPNHRLGDTGRFITGSVSAFRMQSGIRRVLVDAAIIAGNSGGPILNCSGEVIGVAVTGADNDSAAASTENHSFIPISAIDLVL